MIQELSGTCQFFPPTRKSAIEVAEQAPAVALPGDQGNVDLFGYAVLAGEVRDGRIYDWDHETDSRIFFDYTLERYLRQRLDTQDIAESC